MEELRLAVRWSVAQQFIKQPQTFDCEYCESKGSLKEDRNCGWTRPGKCNDCGDIRFEDVEKDRDGSSFTCPICNNRVRFGRSAEFILGKYRTPGCPKSMVSERAVFFIQLVNWSEETGVLPTAKTLFEESLLYFEIRNFITSERAVSEEEMRPKEKK